jgi:hypothetical protein
LMQSMGSTRQFRDEQLATQTPQERIVCRWFGCLLHPR